MTDLAARLRKAELVMRITQRVVRAWRLGEWALLRQVRPDGSSTEPDPKPFMPDEGSVQPHRPCSEEKGACGAQRGLGAELKPDRDSRADHDSLTRSSRSRCWNARHTGSRHERFTRISARLPTTRSAAEHRPHVGHHGGGQHRQPLQRGDGQHARAEHRHRTPFTERSFQVGVLLIVAGIAYSVWILEFVLPTGLSPLHSFVS